MRMRNTVPMLAILVGLALSQAPALAGEIVEKDTGTAFPEVITLPGTTGEVGLAATGVSLREATFLKVNVYAVASYVQTGFDGGDAPEKALIDADVAKSIHMKFVRDVGAEDVAKAYREGIEKNAKDEMDSFAEDLETFLGFYSVDIKVGDEMVISYVPGVGILARHNDRNLDAIDNPELAQAVWSIWFGKKPVSKGMRKDLLSRLQ